MRRSLAVQDTLPVGVEYDKESVGEGYVAGGEGLKGALEMRRGEETWSGQRVSVICMEAQRRSARCTCCWWTTCLTPLESFPELLTAMRTELSLPLAPHERLSRPRSLHSTRSFQSLRSKSRGRPTPFTADATASKTLSFGKGRVMRIGSPRG
ncbi:hypothetical protein CLOP_g3194 [Closterium sp. NIES-67]|nr:hypothetical protein CLOP_g3194 [Closterium sp. NIES-67]